MNFTALSQDSDKTARILLRQGHSESACRLIQSSISEKSITLGKDSIDFQMITLENIELLFQNVLYFIENKKYESAIPPLKTIVSWTSDGEGSISMEEPNKSKYKAYAYFLNGCIDKSLNKYQTSYEFFMMASPLFESCGLVTELVISHVGSSHALMLLERNDEALSQLRTASELLSSADVSSKCANIVHQAMALVYLKQNKVEQATEELNKAVQTQSLSSFLPINPVEPSRCSSASSTHSAGTGPRPPSEITGSARIRANMIKQKRRSQGPFQQTRKDQPELPIKELGQLKLSVNRLMSCI